MSLLLAKNEDADTRCCHPIWAPTLDNKVLLDFEFHAFICNALYMTMLVVLTLSRVWYWFMSIFAEYFWGGSISTMSSLFAMIRWRTPCWLYSTCPMLLNARGRESKINFGFVGLLLLNFLLRCLGQLLVWCSDSTFWNCSYCSRNCSHCS